MKRVVSIGNQDFPSMRERGAFYVDKTSFIREWWESQDKVTLITRPRRFGKTLNMSMVESFFSNQYADRGHLFEGLSIWEEREFRSLQGSYPVIFLSFADIKAEHFESARMGIVRKLVRLYSAYDFIRNQGVLTEKDQVYFDAVSETMEDDAAAVAINYMSDYLSRYYGKKVILLLDEYDAPLQEAYVYGYWDEMAAFIRRLFNSTFKTNPYMERGLMTGITRISKESIFSDLNNLEAVTTTSGKYETAFGFTEQEVREALQDFGLSHTMERVRFWYDGFRFGNRKDIYNPWSITKYLDCGKIGTYWANTSSNSLAGKLIQAGTPEIKMKMEDLLEGRQIETPIDEEIIFDRLEANEEAIWSLLLASGYLKVEQAPGSDEEEELYHLSLTNHEVERMFRKMIREWFSHTRARYNDFVKALLAGDVTYMNEYMNRIAESTFSSFDAGSRPSERAEPERFYHGFVLGLMADSRLDYVITSNRESGFGRYDVVMEPRKRDGKAYVFEFKVRDPGSEGALSDTAEAALAQIVKRNYDAGLVERGIPRENIRHYGFAFEGKRVLIAEG